MATDRIRVTGEPRQQIDVDLLVQAVILIAEQRLRAEQAAEAAAAGDTPDATDGRASA